MFCIEFVAVSFAHEPVQEPHSPPAALGTVSQRVRIAWGRLSELPTGLTLAEGAKKLWKLEYDVDLFKHLKLGVASRTDTVLIRKFSAETGKEEREREVTIFLREGQSDVELLLDLAHELVHATSRPAFDPYDPHLSAGQYIRFAIDGTGGEADAVLAECSVAREMAQRWGSQIHRCRNYLSQSDLEGPSELVLSRQSVVKDFYRVGHWIADLRSDLGPEGRLLPFLSADAPRLYSSAAHAPYPVALLQEYEEMTRAACENSRERKRSLLADVRREKDPQISALNELLASRCGSGMTVAHQ
jgi:hypothetical protein